MDPNDTVFSILREIVESKGTNLYKLSKKLKMPASKVSYHLPALVEAGLVVHDPETGVYIPQPLLVDEEFIAVVEKAIDDIYAAAAKAPDKVYMPSGKIEDVEAALENCIRARVSLAISSQ